MKVFFINKERKQKQLIKQINTEEDFEKLQPQEFFVTPKGNVYVVLKNVTDYNFFLYKIENNHMRFIDFDWKNRDNIYKFLNLNENVK